MKDLQEKEEQRDAQEFAADETAADEGLPRCEDGNEEIGIDEIDGVANETFCGAQAGEEFEDSEPQKDDAETDPENRHSGLGHPVGDRSVDAVEVGSGDAVFGCGH